MLLLDQ
ncbi:hypothetical protein Avbf_16931 [Armadillidium vulgare]|nr:hypothetical protein Avbf_16931 [Armadillidium vulgare]